MVEIMKLSIFKVPLWFIAIVGILLFIPMFNGVSAWDKFGGDNPLSAGDVVYDADISLSAITSGVTQDNGETQAQKLIFTDSQLNSANTTELNFTLNIRRTDMNSDPEGGAPMFKVKPRDMAKYTGRVDNNPYYSVDYSTTTELYNITIDGQSIATSNDGVGVALAQSTTDTMIVQVIFDDYTTYDAQHPSLNQALKTFVPIGFDITDSYDRIIATVDYVYQR